MTSEVRPSSHIINCARCHCVEPEAGVIEAHTIYSVSFFALCKQCVQSTLAFITKGGDVRGENDPEFGVLALLDVDDVDIAEHHWSCACEECVVDGDQQRKFLLENDHDFFEQIYKSA